MINLSYISGIRDSKALLSFFYKFFILVGQGTSRVVYSLNSKYVIKVAKDNKGVWQNESECRMTKEYGNDGLILPIERKDNECLWVVQKKAQPIDTTKDTLFCLDTLCELIDCFEFKNYDKVDDICCNNPFLSNVSDFMLKSQPMFFRDFRKVDSWGYVDGNIRLIDFGMDNDTYRKYIGKYGTR